MIPDYQTLMRPVLECVSLGEVRISDVVELLANKFGLTADERATLLPSGKQTTFANRVHWAKSYLKQAGLVEITRRGHFSITELGRAGNRIHFRRGAAPRTQRHNQHTLRRAAGSCAKGAPRRFSKD